MNARKIVKDAIVAALESAEALEGVTIARHREPEKKNEWVWIYKATGKREYKVLGPRPVPNEEEIEIQLRVVAVRNDSTAAEERAEGLADAVEVALRDVEVASPVLKPLLVQKVEDEPLSFDSKAGHHYLMTVSTQARI